MTDIREQVRRLIDSGAEDPAEIYDQVIAPALEGIAPEVTRFMQPPLTEEIRRMMRYQSRRLRRDYRKVSAQALAADDPAARRILAARQADLSRKLARAPVRYYGERLAWEDLTLPDANRLLARFMALCEGLLADCVAPMAAAVRLLQENPSATRLGDIDGWQETVFLGRQEPVQRLAAIS